MAPTHFGRYEVRRVLGRGGMGLVYAGHDPQIDRPVAIKTIALEALSDSEAAEFEARFRGEMRSAGRLLHPHIVALYDTGREAGTAYIVMELVPGQDLKQRLAAGPPPTLDEALRITLQLLDALGYAHARQVLHRDVKPANLMLQPDGSVKLCDFGVARLTDADATRTQGLLVGTVRYASPEQIGGAPIDARSDLYAAAIVLYELLTGQTPSAGRSDAETLQRIVQQPPQPPSQLRPGLPPALDGVLLRALHKDPAQRFPSAEALAAALRAAAADTAPTQPLPAPAPPTAAAPAAHARWWWLAGLLPLLALAAWALRPRPAAPPPVAVAASAPAAAASAASDVATLPPTPSAPASRTAAAKPALPRLDGSWLGLYSCGETLGAASGPGREPFAAQLAVEIQGSRISWTRGGKTHVEWVSGTIDKRGSFSARGEGKEDGPTRKGQWQVRASGGLNLRVQPMRLDGQVELLRPRDGSVARRCSFSAVPR